MTVLHERACRSPRKLSLLGMLAALILVLTACDWNMSATFHEDETADFMAELKVSQEESKNLQGPGPTFECAELLRLQDQVEIASKLTVDDRSEAGNIHCVVTGNRIPIDELFTADLSVEREDGIYTVGLEPDTGSEPMELEKLGLQFNPTLSFTFPGRVLEASAGIVEGNTVTITDLDVYQKGFSITAEAEKPTSLLTGPLLWLLAGVGFLVLTLLIWMAARKSRPQSPEKDREQV